MPDNQRHNELPASRGELRLSSPRLRAPIAISLGAIAGALSRYYVMLIGSQWFGTAFPFSTLLINLSGAFGMGFFTAFALERIHVPLDVRLLVTVGFLGAYTTFSTYELDAEKLLISGHWQLTSLYWIATAILGVLCLELGSFLARRLP